MWNVHHSALVPVICHHVDNVIDEILLAERQEHARQEALKKKKKKRAPVEFDEFADESELARRAEEAKKAEEVYCRYKAMIQNDIVF